MSVCVCVPVYILELVGTLNTVELLIILSKNERNIS